jgi:NADPH-dependent curcumin reductase CurA
VGSIAGQIAKMKGCRVVGIAGSDEKMKKLKDRFGFDEVINYKTDNINTALEKACPNGVDCYYDNVGGDITDAVINHFNRYARMALCGQISLYNETEIPVGPRIFPSILKTSTLIKGFIVSDYQSRFPEGIKQLTEWVKGNKLKYSETIMHGFDKLPDAFIGLFNGVNTGKMIVKV